VTNAALNELRAHGTDSADGQGMSASQSERNDITFLANAFALPLRGVLPKTSTKAPGPRSSLAESESHRPFPRDLAYLVLRYEINQQTI
jgi:hypothetical protein